MIMSLVTAVYLLGVLENVYLFMVVPITFIGVVLIQWGIRHEDASTREDEKIVRDQSTNLLKSSKKWTILSLLLFTLLPSKDTGEKMLAVYVGTEIADMKEVKQLGGKTYEVINKVMDDFLGEPIEEIK